MQMRTSCCQFSFCGGWKFGLVCVKRNWSPRRYSPISDLGSSHFKFDLAAGFCQPGRLFQSPWKLNLSLKPTLSIPFPAVFWHSRVRQRSSLGARGGSLCCPRSSPCSSQLGVCIPHGVGGIWEDLNVRKAAVHCCAAASPWGTALSFCVLAMSEGLPRHGHVSWWYLDHGQFVSSPAGDLLA